MFSKILKSTVCVLIGLCYISIFVFGEEQTSDDIIYQVQDNIMEQVNDFHDYVTGKMSSLENVCKKNKSFKDLEYHSAGPFQSPVVNKLVEIITEKLEDVAEIFIDDMLLISENVSEVFKENLEERLTLLAEGLNNMSYQSRALVKKDIVIQGRKNISTFFDSRTARLRELFQDVASHLKMTLVAEKLTNRMKKLKGEPKTNTNCETWNTLLEKSLRKTTLTTQKVSEIKTTWLTTKPTCSEVPEQTMTLLDSQSNKNKNSIQSLSAALQNVDSEVSCLLDDLVMELKNKSKVNKDISNRTIISLPRIPVSRSRPVVSQGVPVPTTEQAIVEESPDDANCLDSTFISPVSPPDICGAAVRLDRCLQKYLSFHCCRTCRRAGYSFKLPDLEDSRRVAVLEALNALQQPLIGDLTPGIRAIDPTTRNTLQKLGRLRVLSPISG